MIKEVLEVLEGCEYDFGNCPHCGVEIIKNGGCSHMICAVCKKHFTWEFSDPPFHGRAIDLNRPALPSITELYLSGDSAFYNWFLWFYVCVPRAPWRDGRYYDHDNPCKEILKIIILFITMPVTLYFRLLWMTQNNLPASRYFDLPLDEWTYSGNSSDGAIPYRIPCCRDTRECRFSFCWCCCFPCCLTV